MTKEKMFKELKGMLMDKHDAIVEMVCDEDGYYNTKDMQQAYNDKEVVKFFAEIYSKMVEVTSPKQLLNFLQKYEEYTEYVNYDLLVEEIEKLETIESKILLYFLKSLI